MRFRKLRIAWSVGCVVVALLLCGLWVRSYWWTDGFDAHDAEHEGGVFVERGEFGVAFGGLPRLSRLHLDWSSEPVTPDLNMPGLMGFYCGPHPADPDSGSLLLLPLWFVAILVSAASTLSWTRWLQWQFSLRTLLIATTLVAVLLGLIVYAAEK